LGGKLEFQHVPDKRHAWEDLIRLTRDKDIRVRLSAVYSLGSAIQYIPYRERAWKVLIRLTQNKDQYVRLCATDALGSAFQHVPDKRHAWEDLIRLTRDKDQYVRRYATDALGSAFQHVPDKRRAWEDLIRLTHNKESYVRAYANNSLGKASIFKATETESEGEFRKEMKNALEFFDRSPKEVTYFNPSIFCRLFYGSLYAIMFGKAGAEGEVQKYLADAKSTVAGSKTKETLLKAIESLANALSEAQKVTDFNTIKSDLNACRQYCDRAADLIGDAAEGAPGAARVLRRGLPIIDQRIRELLEEVKKKSESICKAAACVFG